MSVKLVFSVYDSKAEAFLPPFIAVNRGIAMRSFLDTIAQEGHPFRIHAGDFSLFLLANYDEANGSFDNLLAPNQVITGLEALAIVTKEASADGSH